MDASRQSRFLNFFQHPHVEIVACIRLLTHGCVLRGGLVQPHAFAGGLFQALAHQLFAVQRSLPVAAESLNEFRVFRLLLPIEILQLTANLNHARKIGAMFGAELGLFLLQIAAAGVNLLEERGGKVALRLQARIAGDHHLRVALRGGRYSASLRMRSVVAATSWRLNSSISKQSRRVLGFPLLPIGLHLGRAHDAVLHLEIGKALLVLIVAGLQIGELRIEPARCSRRGRICDSFSCS